MYISSRSPLAELRAFAWDHQRVLNGLRVRRGLSQLDASRQVVLPLIEFDASGLPVNINYGVRQTIERHEAIIAEFRDAYDLIPLE